MKHGGYRFCKIFLIFSVLHFWFAASVSAEQVQGIPVLLYHHVTDQEPSGPLTVSPKEFKRQLTLLRTHGFQTISLAQLGSFMRGEQIRLPFRPILITFDDGHADNFFQAFPALKEVGYSAAIFMVGINFDRANRLTVAQIREMNAHDISVGAHSMTHPDLTKTNLSGLRQEIAGSKKTAERVLRTDVGYFAYPGGFYNLAVWEEVEMAGFQGAFCVLPGLNRPERDNLFLLRRIPVFRYTDFDRLLEKLEHPPANPSLLDY